MYGKTFESMYEGSMVGSGIHVFAVWNYIITKQKHGFIEINPKLLAFTLGGQEADIQAALDFLQQPDPLSRSKELEGRRLVKDGQFQYRIVNWAHYDQIRNEIERRDYNRVRKQQQRQRVKAVSVPVVTVTGNTLPEDTDQKQEPEKESVTVRKFIAPNLDMVKLQGAKTGLSELESEKFFNYYASKGWKVGKSPMKDWVKALAGWKLRAEEYSNGSGGIPHNQITDAKGMRIDGDGLPVMTNGDYDFERMNPGQKKRAMARMTE